MKVAIVHDWLVTYAGAERVLEQMLNVFPDADLFSLIDFLPEGKRDFIKNKPVKTTFIQNLPKAKSKYRNYLPFMPLAIEQLDLSEYKLVISSSHAVAKGVLTGPNQLHLCMCYSPIRYAWDLQHQYLKESNLTSGLKSWIAKIILHKIRVWDYRTANGVDGFIAISNFIAARIKKVYGRSSKVIYPPVYIDDFTFNDKKENFYLTSSRMVPYKKIDLIVESFKNMPDKELIVIGDGPDFEKVKSKAGKNVKIMGYQSFSVLKEHMQKAKAFIFAAEEDFGIAPLEAQSCGTPVIAYGKGGALETIVGIDKENPTGLFFYEQTIQSITEAVRDFEALQDKILPVNCRNNSLRFSPEKFRKDFLNYVENEIKNLNYGV